MTKGETVEILYWPDDFAASAPPTDYGVALAAFFDEIIASGGAAYTNSGGSLIGFSRGQRTIEFIRRGRIRRGGEQSWEVLPIDHNECSRLGPLFRIREYACVVVSGLDNIRTLTERWLNETPLEGLIVGVDFWDKMNASLPQEPTTNHDPNR